MRVLKIFQYASTLLLKNIPTKFKLASIVSEVERYNIYTTAREIYLVHM